MITIYHNSRCGKSRDCLAFLETSKNDFEIIKYLESPLSFAELTQLIRKLQLKPIELIRTNETIWKEKFKGKELSDEEIIQSIVDFPILMQRPIVVHNEVAIIARPLEKINIII